MELIRVNQLVKVYNSFKGAKEVTAINNLDLSIHEGEFIGIMGASGSGKTTLLNILSGIDTPTSGDVFINEVNISKMKKDQLALFRREKIGYIFQDFNLLNSLTVFENISLPLILNKMDATEIKTKAHNIMEFFNIEDIHNKYPYNISGGQKQRVATARAIITNPSVVFADEPTGNLDSKSSKNIMMVLNKMNSELNSTILLVTHDPFSASFCKKIIFISDGKVKIEIISNGNREQFFERILEVQGVIGGDIK